MQNVCEEMKSFETGEFVGFGVMILRVNSIGFVYMSATDCSYLFRLSSASLVYIGVRVFFQYMT